MKRSSLHRVILIAILTLLVCAPQSVAVGQGESNQGLAIDANAIVYDGQYIYLAGSITNYQSQSLVNPLDLSGGMKDMVLIKMEFDGTPIYSAVIGGTNSDEAVAIAVDQGVVYLLGETWSTDFPNAPGNVGESDAVLCAVAADGSGLLWARRFAGTDQDAGRALVSYEQDLYLTGVTWSDNLSGRDTLGSADGFLAQVGLDGDLAWLTRFGGSDVDAPYDLMVVDNSIWVVGQTFSRDFGGALHGEGDAFAARFSLTGGQSFAGVFGGSEDDLAFTVSPANDGGLVMAGGTNSDDIPNASGNFDGNFDAVTFQFNSNGEMETAAYLGGGQPEYAQDIVNLADGGYLIIGWTVSPTFSTGGGSSLNSMGGADTFIVRASADGVYSLASLEGGAGDDYFSAGVLVPGGLWLAGDFQDQGLGYALFISSDDFGGIENPTETDPALTATNAYTATLAPTETPAPNRESTPTSSAAQVLTSTAALQVTAEPTTTGAADLQQSGMTATPNGSQGNGSSAMDETPQANSSPEIEAENQGEDDSRNSGLILGGMGVGIVILVSAGIYWFRRKNKSNSID